MLRLVWLVGLVRAGMEEVALEQHALLPKRLEQLAGDDLVDYINGLGTTWQAARSERFADLARAARLMGLQPLPADFVSPLGENAAANAVRYNAEPLPAAFDARQRWPHCRSLRRVRDQSNCGSCWAMAAAAAISDRICIRTGLQVEVSAADLMGCCHICGGCHGGLPELAWAFYWLRGVVSGGEFGDTQSCRPYPFPKCAHHTESTKYPTCNSTIFDTPKCVKKCVDGQTAYSADIHKAKYAYPIVRGERAIQRDIMTNGPVETGFLVFSDFLTYKSGVYQHQAGSLLGGHAVKILGWGVDNGTAYWLVANSWNELWGESGFFRILRGHNHLGIETRVTAGVPRDL